MQVRCTVPGRLIIVHAAGQEIVVFLPHFLRASVIDKPLSNYITNPTFSLALLLPLVLPFCFICD